MELIEYEEKHATLRVLITGLTGSGKTTLAATLAAKYHLIWIDTENSLESLSKLPLEYKKNIQVIKIPDSGAFPVAAQTVQNLFKNLKASICLNHGVINCPICVKEGAIMQDVDFTKLDNKRDVVVLDSLTQVGASFLAHIMKNREVTETPERGDWGGLRRNTEYLGSSIQRFPFNFVATALCAEVELEDKSVKLVPSFGSKDMGANIGAKFGSIVFCKVENRKHKAYSSSTASNMFLTKSRTDYKIEDLPIPSLVPMFDEYLSGEIAAVPEPSATETNVNKPQQQVTAQAKGILMNLKKT